MTKNVHYQSRQRKKPGGLVKIGFQSRAQTLRGFMTGAHRNQVTLFSERLDDYIAKKKAARMIKFFIDEFD